MLEHVLMFNTCWVFLLSLFSIDNYTEYSFTRKFNLLNLVYQAYWLYEKRYKKEYLFMNKNNTIMNIMQTFLTPKEVEEICSLIEYKALKNLVILDYHK